MHNKVLAVLALLAGLLTAWASGTTAGPTPTGSAAPAPAGSVTPGAAPTGEATPTRITRVASEVASTVTSTVTTAAPLRTRLVVSAAGDTNLDPDYIPVFRTEGYGHAFTGLQDIFRRDDLTIVNLECAASELGAPVPKEFNFNCDPAALPVMKAAGVEVANLANNHGMDYGVDALLDTKANVIRAGLAPTGVGRDRADAATPALFGINGWTVAVVGFNGVIPSPDWIAGPDTPGMADGDTIETMVAAVEAADELADLVFVVIHWGVELDTTPRPDDVDRARAMIAAGADAIFGHHSHRLNPLETVEGKPVAWGLGNFVWPRLSDAGATSAIAQVIVEPDGSLRSCLIPVFIESDGHPVVQVDYQDDCRW